jgi:hypothetical protein
MVAARLIKKRTKIGMSQSRISILVHQVAEPPCRAEAKLDHTAMHKISARTRMSTISKPLRRYAACVSATTGRSSKLTLSAKSPES